MRAVNLLPRDEAKRSFEAKRGVFFGGVGGAALATAVLASMMIERRRRGEQQAGGARRAARADRGDPDRAGDRHVRGGRARGREGRPRRRALRGARRPHRLGPRAPPGLARAARGRLADEPLRGALPTRRRRRPRAAGFTLTGATYSQNGVARFLSRLAVIPDLANVRLQSSQSQLLNERELVQFTILADVRPPGSAPAPAVPADAQVPPS